MLDAVNEIASTTSPTVEFVATECLRLQMTDKQLRNMCRIIREGTTILYPAPPGMPFRCRKRKRRSSGFFPSYDAVTKKIKSMKSLVRQKIPIMHLPNGKGAPLELVVEMAYMKLLKDYPEVADASRIHVWIAYDGCRLGKSSQSNSSHTEFTL
eukprot:756787-Hanusia_phi.AAC.1